MKTTDSQNLPHTPGPLAVSHDCNNPAPFTVIKSVNHQPNAGQAGVGYVKATARCYHEADAILYAAAPELLAALERLVMEAGFTSGECEPTLHDLTASVSAFRSARAAIAKATQP